MKKKMICLVGLAFLSGAVVMGQNTNRARNEAEFGEGFYVRFGGGYSFGAGKTGQLDALNMPGCNYSEMDDDGDETFTQKRKAFSLGQGVDLMIGARYMFTPYIGIDLSFSTVFGSPAKATYKSSSIYRYESSGNISANIQRTSTEETLYKLGYSGFYLTPAVRLCVPVSGRFSLYSRIGVALPVYQSARYSTEETVSSTYRGHSDIFDDRNDYNQSSRSSSIRAARLDAYFRPGFNAVLGVDIAIGQHLGVYAEVEAMVQSFAVKRSTLVEYIEDGDNLLSSIDPEDRVHEYVRKIDQDTPGDPEISYNIPANSIGINIGIVYRF